MNDRLESQIEWMDSLSDLDIISAHCQPQRPKNIRCRLRGAALAGRDRGKVLARSES